MADEYPVPALLIPLAGVLDPLYIPFAGLF
jgi:hypothetical protein